jgi:hypothetical protein
MLEALVLFLKEFLESFPVWAKMLLSAKTALLQLTLRELRPAALTEVFVILLSSLFAARNGNVFYRFGSYSG